MARLKDKIENALNETRILVLGLQILIGFAFRSFFEPGFSEMSRPSQFVQLATLAMMLVCLGLMIVPIPYHRLVLEGRDTNELHRLATATVSAALLPFAMSMAISFFLAVRWVTDARTATLSASALLGLTLFFWYGLELGARKRKHGKLHLHATLDPLRGVVMGDEEHTDLTTRVKQVLIECRVVLPGAQALLGFQLIIMWMEDFRKIPQGWKLLHLASLTAIAVCTILLVTPAAYHRIVEQGEDSEDLVRFTSRTLLWAMVFLALGVCGDCYVVCRVTGISPALSGLGSSALLVLFLGSWFGYAAWKARQARARRPPATLTGHPAA
jgi:hypothetical protein